MSQLVKNRRCISIVTALTFVPTVLTSLMLLFHFRFPGILEVHKWIGLVFVLSCLFHIPINWAVLRNHFNDRSAIPFVVLACCLVLSLLLIGGTGDNGKHRRHNKGFFNEYLMK